VRTQAGSAFKLAITGTPMKNNLMELWSLLSITARGLFPSPTKFTDFYAKTIEKTSDPELLAVFRRRIKPLVKRRTNSGQREDRRAHRAFARHRRQWPLCARVQSVHPLPTPGRRNASTAGESITATSMGEPATAPT